MNTAMSKGILFLTLRVFSATGGIEKVCKVVCRALMNGDENPNSRKLSVLSMYDKQADVDDKYLSPSLFTGFAEKKIRFVKKAIMEGRCFDVVILSHINLLSIGFLIKMISPKTRLVLFAHGIEVWGPLSLARRKMLKQCDQVLAVSEFTKKTILQQYQLKEEKVTVLNNCLDPYLPPAVTGKDKALQSRYGLTKDNMVLMTLTRLSSKELYKGYAHVLLSIHALKIKFPGIKYLIVGRYDEMEKKRLDSIICQYSLQDDIIFTGYIPDEELAKHYSLADIYVMPSKKEGFGIVFIEAMHYGLPVIAGNKDGSADALCDGKLGLLVDPDDQNEIDTAIEKIILNKACFEPNQELLIEAFSYNNYKKKLAGILGNLIPGSDK
jgi:phosphatidyl-myo-inositol dimannoside synthase